VSATATEPSSSKPANLVEVGADQQDDDGQPAIAWVQYGDLSVAVTQASDGSGRFIVNLESMTEEQVTVNVTVDGDDAATFTTV
jgi:hypothetical protein